MTNMVEIDSARIYAPQAAFRAKNYRFFVDPKNMPDFTVEMPIYWGALTNYYMDQETTEKFEEWISRVDTTYDITRREILCIPPPDPLDRVRTQLLPLYLFKFPSKKIAMLYRLEWEYSG